MPIFNPEPTTILEEGVVVKTKGYVNFIGDSVTATYNSAAGRVDVTIASGGVGDMTKAVYDVEDEGAIRLTPRTSSDGPEGTMFYDSVDKCIYVGVETG